MYLPLLECRLNLSLSWLGSVTYLSVCLRRLSPGVKSPDHDMHLANRWPLTATGIFDSRPSIAGLTWNRH